MNDFSNFSSGVISSSGAINSSLSSITNTIAKVVVTIGSLVAAAKGLEDIVSTFREFDDTMVSVAKTTGMVGEELSTLRSGLEEMATQGPVSASSLGEIASVAGQLGIEGSDNIMKFTETISQMSVATGTAAEQLATDMAKISNAFSMPIEQVGNLGSAINELENTTAAATQDIVQGMTNAAASAGTLGMTAPDIAAMTATLVSMGESGLDAGTQLNRAFTEMSQNYEQAAAQMGMSSEEFKRMMDEDMTQAVMAYLEYLSQIPSQTDKINQATEVVGAVGAKAFSKLSEGIDPLLTNMANANVAFEEGTSLLQEYQVAAESFGGVMDTMANQFDTIKIAIGDTLAPIFMELAESVESNLIPALQQFADLLNTMDFSGIEGSINAIITSISQMIETLNQSSAGVQSIIDVFNALAVGISAAAQTIISAIETIVVSIDALKKAFDAAGEAKGLDKLSAFTSTWSAEMSEGLTGIKQDWESWWESFQTSTSDIKPVEIKVTLSGQEEVDNYINFLKAYSEEGHTISSTIKIEGKEEYEQFMSQMETVPDTKATLIRSEVNDEGVEEFVVKIKSIPETVHTSITPTIDNEESFNNFVNNFKGLEGVTANVTLSTEITGENAESIAQSVAELGQTDVKIRVNFENMETLQQFQSYLEEIGADVKVSQVRAEVSGTGDIENITAMIESIPEQKDIKITINKDEVFNIDNILEGLKREVLINIGVAITGEEDIEQVKEFIDSTPTEKAFQLVCSILGEEKVEEIGSKIQELTRLPGEIVKKVMIDTMGEEKVKEVQEAINIIPQEKIAQVVVDTAGVDELTNVQDTLEVMPSNVGIESDVKTIETKVEGLEDVEKLKSAIDSIPTVKTSTIKVVTESQVKPIETSTEPIASMKTGGGVPETGLYMLHKGEEVIPADKKAEILGSYQGGTISGGTISGAKPTLIESEIINVITSAGEDLLKVMKDLMMLPMDAVIDGVKQFVSIITDFIALPINILIDGVKEITKVIVDLISLPFTTVINALNTISDTILDFMLLPLTEFIRAVNKIVDAIVSIVTTPFDELIETITDIINIFTDLVAQPIREFADQLYMFIDPIKTVSNLFDALSNPLATISSLLNKLTNIGVNNANTNNNVVVNYNPIIERDVDIDTVTNSLLRRISVGF